MRRLTKKTSTGEYEWADDALEAVKASNDPTIIGQTARRYVGICEDYGLAPDDILKFVLPGYKDTAVRDRALQMALDKMVVASPLYRHLTQGRGQRDASKEEPNSIRKAYEESLSPGNTPARSYFRAVAFDVWVPALLDEVDAKDAEIARLTARNKALARALKQADYQPLCFTCTRGDETGCAPEDCTLRSGYQFDVTRFSGA